jgi:hypothetical protein
MNTVVKPPSGTGPVEKPTVHKHRVQQPAIPLESSSEETSVELMPPAWPVRVPLAKPIYIKNAQNGQVIKTIEAMEFREPTAQDIITCGVPVIMIDYAQGTTSFDAPKMAAMMSRLSKIPPNYIGAMDSRDFINCATMLQQNFLPDWGRML